MIEEVVNSILEAEDIAQKRIAAAKEEAAGIVSAAEIKADKFKTQASAENKKYFAEKSQNIGDDAREGAEKLLAQLNAETDNETAEYRKNMDKAVKIILEQLL